MKNLILKSKVVAKKCMAVNENSGEAAWCRSLLKV